MVVHIDQVPEPEGHKPSSANVHTVSLAHHRFLIPAQELEIVFDTMSADYRVILWNVTKEGKKKLHKVDKPAAQELKTVSSN